MDLDQSNLDARLENVLMHHNAIRKGLKKKFIKRGFEKTFDIAPKF